MTYNKILIVLLTHKECFNVGFALQAEIEEEFHGVRNGQSGLALSNRTFYDDGNGLDLYCSLWYPPITRGYWMLEVWLVLLRKWI